MMSIYAIIGFLSCFGAFFLLESIIERVQLRHQKNNTILQK